MLFKKRVFLFGEEDAGVNVLGGKGQGLSNMVRLGLSVPFGFTIPIYLVRHWVRYGYGADDLKSTIQEGLTAIEEKTGRKFGDSKKPLLVSVRSGAAVSMPGMMDTVLNVGLNPKTVEGLAKLSGSKLFAWDSYRRFLEMYSEIVLPFPRSLLERELEAMKKKRGVDNPNQLSVQSLKLLCSSYHKCMANYGYQIPEDLFLQLEMAVRAICSSWNNDRACKYREENGIPDNLGTAINIQAMVFGNRDEDSGTGVVFSRNVSTGERGLYGEFMMNAQGEDIVSGVRTPQPIAKMEEWNSTLYSELTFAVQKLEEHYNDIVDVEFTVESGKLYILQVRVAKRTPEAAITAAVHFVEEGKWTREKALKAVTRGQIDSVSRPVFVEKKLEKAVRENLIAKGIPASRGAAVGRVARYSNDAVTMASRGEKVILVRSDTSPNDISGMLAAEAIVTQKGGATSHAAVFARSVGKPTVVGVGNISRYLDSGALVSVDGTTGVVVLGSVDMTDPEKTPEITTFLSWLDESTLKWPKPRVDFDYFGRQMSIHQLINDFYLSDALASTLAGTSLEEEASKLRQRIHLSAAERLVTYLVVAVAGELRHYDLDIEEEKPEKPVPGNFVYADSPDEELKLALATYKRRMRLFNRLEKQEGLSTYTRLRLEYRVLHRNVCDNRETAQSSVVARLLELNSDALVGFFRLAEKAFREEDRWDSGYGGELWANIAKCAAMFLTGKLNHTAFVDHAFDLRHNGGSVFDKHKMISGFEDHVIRQLKAKKKARNTAKLFPALNSLFREWDEDVLALYQKAEKGNLLKVKQGKEVS